MSPMKRKSSLVNFLDHQEKRSHLASDEERLAKPVSALLPSASKTHPATTDFSSSSRNPPNCSSSSSFGSPCKTDTRITNAYRKANDGTIKPCSSLIRRCGRRTNDLQSTSCSNPNIMSVGSISDSSCYAARKTNLRASSCSSYNENKISARSQTCSFNKFNVSPKIISPDHEYISKTFSIIRTNSASSIPLLPTSTVPLPLSSIFPLPPSSSVSLPLSSTFPLPPSPHSTVAGSVLTSYQNQSNANPSQWFENVGQNEQAVCSASAQSLSSYSPFNLTAMPSYESTSFHHYENSNVQHVNSEGRVIKAIASSGSSTAFQSPCETFSAEYDNSIRNKYQRALDVSSALGSHASYQHSAVPNASYASSLQLPLLATTATTISRDDSQSENCRCDSLMLLNISFESQENGDDVFSFSEVNNDSNSSTLHKESTKRPSLSRPGKFASPVNNSNKYKIIDVCSPLGTGSSGVASRKAEPQRKSSSDVLDEVNPAHCENWDFGDIDGDSTVQNAATKSSSSLKTVNDHNHKKETDLGSHDQMNKFETFEVPCSSSLKRLSKPFSIADALMLTPKLDRLDDPLAEGNYLVDIPSPVSISPAEIPLPPSFSASVINDSNNFSSTPKKTMLLKTSSRSVKTSLSKPVLELRKLWNKWSTSSVAINDSDEGTFLQRHLSKSSQDPDGKVEATVSAKKASRSVSLSAMPDGGSFTERTTFRHKKTFPTHTHASITASLPQQSRSSSQEPLSSDPQEFAPTQRFWLANTAAINSKLSASHSQGSSSLANLSDIPDTSSNFDLRPSSFHWRRSINSSAAEEASSCHYDTNSSTAVVNPRTAYFASEWKELASSQFSTGFIDTHCHLDFLFNKVHHFGTLEQFKLKMEDDCKDELKFPASYEGCIAVFCQPDSFHKVRWQGTLLAEEGVWAAFGCHPHFSNRFGEQQLKLLRQALTHPKVVALGEIGLDYSHKNNHSPSVQQAVFRQQLLLAEELHLPLVIHCRDAHDDTLQILKKHVSSSTRIHRHCFADSWQEAEEWLQAFPKCFLGLTNLLTQRNSQARMVCEAVRQVPLHRLLLETDAPYFVPDCVRGVGGIASHPGHALLVAAEVARIKGLTLDEVLVAVRRNTRDMYGI